jgi:hypothetical protein
VPQTTIEAGDKARRRDDRNVRNARITGAQVPQTTIEAGDKARRRDDRNVRNARITGAQVPQTTIEAGDKARRRDDRNVRNARITGAQQRTTIEAGDSTADRTPVQTPGKNRVQTDAPKARRIPRISSPGCAAMNALRRSDALPHPHPCPCPPPAAWA